MSKYCTNCGNEIEDSAKFCPECGSPVQTGENAPKTVQVITPTPLDSTETHAQATGMKNTENKSKHSVLRILYYINAVVMVVYALNYDLPQFRGGSSIPGLFLLLLSIVLVAGCWIKMTKLASKNVTYTKLLIWQIIAYAINIALFTVTETGAYADKSLSDGLETTCNFLAIIIALISFAHLIRRTIAEHEKEK